jgi:hypothetical protein
MPMNFGLCKPENSVSKPRCGPSALPAFPNLADFSNRLLHRLLQLLHASQL